MAGVFSRLPALEVGAVVGATGALPTGHSRKGADRRVRTVTPFADGRDDAFRGQALKPAPPNVRVWHSGRALLRPRALRPGRTTMALPRRSAGPGAKNKRTNPSVLPVPLSFGRSYNTRLLFVRGPPRRTNRSRRHSVVLRAILRKRSPDLALFQRSISGFFLDHGALGSYLPRRSAKVSKELPTIHSGRHGPATGFSGAIVITAKSAAARISVRSSVRVLAGPIRVRLNGI